MGSNVGNSSPESQPTQVINNILAGSIPDASSSENSTETDNVLPPERHIARDTLSDPTSSTYDSGPRYHYYGLADTQTQTGEENPAGSDALYKENAPSKDPQTELRKPLSEKGPQPLTRQQPCFTPVLQDPVGSKADLAAGVTKLATNAISSHPLKASKHPFPSRPYIPTISRENMQRGTVIASRPPVARRRASSSSSDDSFAGPAVLEDPEKAFLAASKQFDKPLSELGRDSMQDDSTAERLSSPEADRSSFAVASALIPPQRGSSPITQSPQSSPRPATVLVEATPSNTDYSQSSQVEPYAEPFPTLESPAPRGLPYNPLNSQMPSSPLVPTQIFSDHEDAPTQPADFEPTQPMDEDEVNAGSGPAISSGRDQTSTSSRPFGRGSYPSTVGPRSLLAMVNPETLKQRYPGIRVVRDAPPPNLPSASDGQTQPSTQIDPGPASLLFEHIMASRSENARASAGAATHPPPSIEHGVNERDFDVIPDSEPTQMVDESPPTPKSKDAEPIVIATKPPLSKAAPEEEEEEEEEDIPLAVVSKGKGKSASRGAAVSRAPVKFGPPSSRQGGKSAAGKPGPSARGAKPSEIAGVAKPAKGTHNSTPNEVPSSVPQQDMLQASTSDNTVPSSTPVKSKNAAAAEASVRGTPRRNLANDLLARSESPLSQTSDDEVPQTQQDPLDLISRTKREEEEGTEPADDVPMDVDEAFVQPGPSTVASRKRKRVPSTRINPRLSSRTSKTPSATPAPRSVKRIKGQTSTARSTRVEATRVFALWRSNNCYYSGTVFCHSDKGPTRFKIHFDDETYEDNIDISKMRRCEPRVGDSVIVNDSEMSGKVTRGCGGDSQEMLEVEIDHGAELECIELRVKDIRIAARSFVSQWRDRTINVDDIVPLIAPKPGKMAYSPSKSSVLSSASHRNTRPKALAKTGFVLTFSVNHGDAEKTRAGMEQRIVANGGTTLKDWSDILQIGSKRTAGSKRWVITRDDFTYKPKAGFDKVFLVSDDANRKPKYLMALALGVPCVSLEWLDTLHDDTIESWTRYLLPAGLPEQLPARVSQVIDMDWGISDEHLSEILTNPVAPKVFTSKSILLVGTEYFPVPAKGRRAASNDNGMDDSVPRIILCMGAERVEVVPEIKAASQEAAAYDYVIVKDEASSEYKNPENGSCVTMGWVKDCLIVGRLLPVVRA